ncbi:MAG: universal stress protein [Nitrospiria bacterium]
MKIKKILIPTDFSDLSKEAIDIALPLAKQFGASVVFLHVLERMEGREDEEARFNEGDGYLWDRSRALLDDLVGQTEQKGMSASAEIGKGTPYVEILRTAEKIGADLIMMGTHGRKGLDRVLLGSQAEKVVRMASCPVTTIKIKGDS